MSSIQSTAFDELDRTCKPLFGSRGTLRPDIAKFPVAEIQRQHTRIPFPANVRVPTIRPERGYGAHFNGYRMVTRLTLWLITSASVNWELPVVIARLPAAYFFKPLCQFSTTV